MDNRRRLLLKLRLVKLRRKTLMLSSQLYGNYGMYQRGLNGDRLFRREFALRVTEMRTSDPEEFFGYFRMEQTAFDEIEILFTGCRLFPGIALRFPAICLHTACSPTVGYGFKHGARASSLYPKCCFVGHAAVSITVLVSLNFGPPRH